MPITASPYYYNPQMGQITSNLATAIYGDPEARMKGAYYNSEVTKNEADARKLGSEADIAGGRYRAQQGMTPEAMATLAQQPGETPIQHAMRIAPLLSSVAQYGTGAKDVAEGTGSMLGDVFSMGNPDDKRTSLVMQGKMPGKDFAGSRAESDAISARDAGQDRQTKTAVANIDNQGKVAVANIDQGGENTRFYNKPIDVNQGQNVYLSPTDPRYGKVGDKSGVVRGNANAETVRGQAGEQMLAGDTDAKLPGLFNGSGGVPKPGAKPTAINGRSMDDIVLNALGGVPGAVDRSNPLKPFVDPNFNGSVDPGKLQAAKDAAATEMQRSGNVAQAGKVFLNTLGIQNGSSFGKQGGFFGLGGNYQVIPPAGTPAPAAAPQAPAGPPVVHSAAQLPAPAARKIGMTVTTPKGDMTWNGQGWVPAGPVN